MENEIKEYEIFVDARAKANYYKGEVLPFIHKLCRKDMTSGDIDGFIWDYKKKKYYVIEQKRINERHKDSQDLHLIFINNILNKAKESDKFSNYEFGVFKIIGDPPFQSCAVQKFNDSNYEEKLITRMELIEFLNLNKSFEDL